MVDAVNNPTRPTTLVDTVLQQIRNWIQTSEFRPGDRLPGEIELADQLGVSRSVVREAIGRLQTIGLLNVVRGRGGGTFVGDQDSVLNYAKVVGSAMSICDKEAWQFAEFRAALEIHSARRAAEIATAADVAELRRLSERTGNPLPGGDAAIADFEFHQKLATIAGNELIIHTLRLAREFVTSIMRKTGPHNPQRTREQHLAVTEAIGRHDPEAAERAMRIHMNSVIEYLAHD